MRKLFLLLLFFCLVCSAQYYPPSSGAGAAAIACVGTPGNTTGSYRQACTTTAGVAYYCNNAVGCTVAADWAGPTNAVTVTFNTTTPSCTPSGACTASNTCVAGSMTGGTTSCLIVTHNLGTDSVWVNCLDSSGNAVACGSSGLFNSGVTAVGSAALDVNRTQVWFTGPSAGTISISTGSMGPVGPTGPQGPGPTTNQNTRRIAYAFDGGGSALSGTLDACQVSDFAMTITGVTLIADQSGSATVDVRTVAYSSYTGAASASTITASDTPALSTAIKYQDTTLTGWTTTLAANTVVCFHVTTPSTVTWLVVDVKGTAN